MQLKFYKYHGAGNDFIIIDDRKSTFPKQDNSLIKKLCNRRFGIGADGLMLLQLTNGYDFKMIYFNADGNESTMCGNGGRCITHFANNIGLIKNKTNFLAVDGEHLAEIEGNIINLQMIDVKEIEKIGNDFYLHTGSPHYVKFVDNSKDFNVYNEGKAIRNSPRFTKEGTNVNFIEQISENEIAIRTYERGVEDETLACGTGVTAAAIVFGLKKNINSVKVKALGGELEVKFEKDNATFKNIWLKGPATMVFNGEIEL